MSEEAVKWLREQVTQRMETAREACGPAWRLDVQASCECCTRVVRDQSGALVVTPDDRDAPHIALNDPQDVIARCEAELAILDLHEAEYGPQHPCKDWLYPCKSTRLLASGYRHREGYAGHWADTAS